MGKLPWFLAWHKYASRPHSRPESPSPHARARNQFPPGLAPSHEITCPLSLQRRQQLACQQIQFPSAFLLLPAGVASQAVFCRHVPEEVLFFLPPTWPACSTRCVLVYTRCFPQHTLLSYCPGGLDTRHSFKMYNMNMNRLALLVLATTSAVLAHGNEDHTSSVDAVTNNGTVDSMADMMMMTPYFHWMANADALYFKAWVPRTPGTLAGACIGLFFLAVFERFLAGAKGLLEAWWRRRTASHAARALVTPDNASTHSHTKSIESGTAYFLNTAAAPLIPAFEPAHDVVRGVMQAVQSLIGFFLMLSVMTYNAAFLISVVLGLGIGEIVFARLGRSGAHPGCVAARSG